MEAGVTDESGQRAVTALQPFVRAYNLPLNPEDLALMAYVVLKYAHSDEPVSDIVPAVEALITDHLAEHSRMYDPTWLN